MITLEKANKELKKVADYLEKNESAWNEQRNLKLYDAAFYDYSKDFPLVYKNYGENEFWDFCQDEYNNLLEWLDENDIDKNIFHYIGRTSSFYIGKYGNEDIINVVDDIYSNNVYGNAFNYINISSDYKITPFNEWKLTDDEVQDELNYIVSNLFDDVKATFEPIIKVANYIDEYKINQVDYFKNYLSYYEDELQAEKEERDAEIEANNKKVSTLINKVKSVITLDELNMINRLYINEEE